MIFEKQRIESRFREFRQATRIFSTDGMPVDLSSYAGVQAVIAELEHDGYRIAYAECFARFDSSPLIGFFVVGEIVATKGDGELIYRFTPEYELRSKQAISFDQLLSSISVRQDRLLYTGEYLVMGRGQYRSAEEIARRLVREHPLLEASTPIYVPCLTRKGRRGSKGLTIAGREFRPLDLAATGQQAGA